MSKALTPLGGLRWWNREELNHRALAEKTIHQLIELRLFALNQAWRFYKVEAPQLIPANLLSAAYGEDDVFYLRRNMGEHAGVLRPETTAGSYLYAQHLLDVKGVKHLPLCVWQVGKSFRVESSDGASASNLRFNEFTQAEWQCIYRADTKANYRDAVLPRLAKTLEWLCGAPARVVPSDRLPSYSQETLDVEVLRPASGDKQKSQWKEVCSVSLRTDFSYAKLEQPLMVLEIAVGLDRVVEIATETQVVGAL